AALFVKRARLKRVRIEAYPVAAALAGIGLGLVHQRGRPAPTADRFVDPEIADVQPAAPDSAEEAAQGLAARASHEEMDGIVARQAGDPDVVHVQAIAHELRLGAARLVEHDLQVILRFQRHPALGFLQGRRACFTGPSSPAASSSQAATWSRFVSDTTGRKISMLRP